MRFPKALKDGCKFALFNANVMKRLGMANGRTSEASMMCFFDAPMGRPPPPPELQNRFRFQLTARGAVLRVFFSVFSGQIFTAVLIEETTPSTGWNPSTVTRRLDPDFSARPSTGWKPTLPPTLKVWASFAESIG